MRGSPRDATGTASCRRFASSLCKAARYDPLSNDGKRDRARARPRERARARGRGRERVPGEGAGGETRERGEGERDPLRRSTEVDKMGGKT
jgi:hypothetical protein